MGRFLKVLTLNTWGIPFAPDKRQRMKNIGAAIAKSDYDIVGLQEIWNIKDLPIILDGAKQAGLEHHHHFASGIFGSGLVILSRFPIIDVRFMPFRLIGMAESIYHGDYLASKGVGLARIQTPETVIDVYLAHTIAQYKPDNEDAYLPHRTGQFFDMTRFINAHSTNNPIIAVGDFNTRPDQIGYRTFATLTNLTDCYLECNPDSKGMTYDVQNPYLARSSGASRRLDYIFAGNGLKSSRAEVVFKTTNDIHYSDHYGVEAYLELNAGDTLSPHPDTNDILNEISTIIQHGLCNAKKRKRRYFWHIGIVILGYYILRKGRKISLPITMVYMLYRVWLAFITVAQEINHFRSIIKEVNYRP